MTMISPSPRRMFRRRTRRQVVIWTAVAATISLCTAALPFLEVRGVAAIPVAQALVPLGVIALALLALTAAFLRLWAAALVLVLGAVIGGVPTLTPVRTAQACEISAPLTVMSFNTKLADADPAALSELIRTSESDAVILLEADERLIDELLTAHGLVDVLPYRTREVSAGQASGSVILSAYPLSLE